MATKRTQTKEVEAAPVEKATKESKAAKPAMSLDQQMVHAALNAGVEA